MLFFPTLDSINMYLKVGKIFFVNNYKKKLKDDVEYNFKEITESSRRIFRNVLEEQSDQGLHCLHLFDEIL